MIKGARKAGRSWEPEEDKQLREMVEAGKSVTLMRSGTDEQKRLFDSACIFSTFNFAITEKPRQREPPARLLLDCLRPLLTSREPFGAIAHHK